MTQVDLYFDDYCIAVCELIFIRLNLLEALRSTYISMGMMLSSLSNACMGLLMSLINTKSQTHRGGLVIARELYWGLLFELVKLMNDCTLKLIDSLKGVSTFWMMNAWNFSFDFFLKWDLSDRLGHSLNLFIIIPIPCMYLIFLLQHPE